MPRYPKGYKDVEYHVPGRKRRVAGSTVATSDFLATTIIPKRFTEGYGVSTPHVKDVSNALIITVDNGISAGSILTDARKERGNYVVVVDHHLPDADVPEVDAIIDPHYYSSGGFTHYCGAGLAYQLAMYMISEDVAPETLCNDLLILAAVGTVADSMPLIGDNRLIVSKALAVANNRFAPMSAGLRCLLDACGDPGTLRANTLSYKLSPMLNAPGRLYDSGGSSVLKALLCKDQELGNSYVTKMVAINQDRKRMVEAYLSLACDSAQGQSSPIVVYLPGLLEGLLGVVAGRLIGTFNSTVVVLSDSRDGKAIKGSVRAVPGDNAKELLDSVRNLLTVYGGHSGAAGMTLERANLDAFTDALKEMRSSHSVCSNLLYDVELSQETVFRSMRALNRFEPLGHGVPNPVCVIRNVEVQDVAYMGQDTIDEYVLESAVYTVLGEDIRFTNSALINALDSLSEENRTIILATCVMGLPDREIAEHLKVVRRTLTYRKAKLLQELRRVLSDV